MLRLFSSRWEEWALFPKKAYDITKKLLSDCNLFFCSSIFFLFLRTCVFYCWILQRICTPFLAVVFLSIYVAIYYLRLALLGVNKSQIIFSHKKCHISWCIQFQFHCQFFPLSDFSLSQSFPFFFLSYFYVKTLP